MTDRINIDYYSTQGISRPGTDSGSIPYEFWGEYEKRGVPTGMGTAWWRKAELRIDEPKSVVDFIREVDEFYRSVQDATIEIDHDAGSGDYSCTIALVVSGWRVATRHESEWADLHVKHKRERDRMDAEEQLARAQQRVRELGGS